MLNAGEIFESRYRITSVLGEGGFAQVFSAEDLTDGTFVAIKVLKHDGIRAYKKATRARFNREVRLLSQLSSPHTVRLFWSGESSDGDLFMVFEQVPGRDLSEYLAAVQRLPPHLVKTILRQIAVSLAEAHGLGLIHRDLKPENVRVFENERGFLEVKLLDFGIARATDAGHPNITRTGELIGTPRYMAPEQILERPLSPASDVYSLGMMTLELVVGRDHLPSNRFGDQFDRLVTGYVFSIPESERVGSDLIELILKMTARDPADRFPDAGAVLAAFETTQVAPRPQPLPPGKPHLPAYNPQPNPYPLLPPGDRPAPEPAPPNRALAVGAAVVFAVGCLILLAVRGGASDEPVATTPVKPRAQASTPPSAAPAPVAEQVAERTTGCGHAPPEDGCLKEFCTRAPEGYTKDARHPLLVVAHPDGVTPGAFMARFEALADANGVVLLAPTAKRAPPWRDDDGLYVGDDVRLATQDYCIDETRIFAFGSQDGGNLVGRLDCTKIPAAVAIHGYIYQSDDEPWKCVGADYPTPVIWLAPESSARWPIGGGGHCRNSNDETLGIRDTARAWAVRNQCAVPPKLGDEGCVALDCPKFPTEFCILAGGVGSEGMTGSCAREEPAAVEGFDVVINRAWDFFERVAPPPSE